MRVLLLGANGYLGPHVVKALAPHHRLRITDIRPAPASIKAEYAAHEFLDVDVGSPGEVQQAALGMDAIVNLSVVRTHPRSAFQVNMLGCWNVMQAAAVQGIRRVINTGPHFTVAGPSYEDFDFAIPADVPPHPGTNLYALTKSLGQEICRQFTRQHEIWVLEFLFYSLVDPAEVRRGAGGVAFTVSWPDAAAALRLGLEIDLRRLPTKCEVFFIHGDNRQGKFSNEKAHRLLGFAPKADINGLWKAGRP